MIIIQYFDIVFGISFLLTVQQEYKVILVIFTSAKRVAFIRHLMSKVQFESTYEQNSFTTLGRAPAIHFSGSCLINSRWAVLRLPCSKQLAGNQDTILERESEKRLPRKAAGSQLTYSRYEEIMTNNNNNLNAIRMKPFNWVKLKGKSGANSFGKSSSISIS